MTPRQLRDAANTPWEDGDECIVCKGLGRLYYADFDQDGPRPGFEECAACKGTGKRPR